MSIRSYCIHTYDPNREYYVGCVWCITTYDPNNRKYYVGCVCCITNYAPNREYYVGCACGVYLPMIQIESIMLAVCGV